jgi:hypothetical protein
VKEAETKREQKRGRGGDREGEAERQMSACADAVQWGADVLDAADAIGWSRFALLGHSMGARHFLSALLPVCVTRGGLGLERHHDMLVQEGRWHRW